jgi:hypothetical protein
VIKPPMKTERPPMSKRIALVALVIEFATLGAVSTAMIASLTGSPAIAFA